MGLEARAIRKDDDDDDDLIVIDGAGTGWQLADKHERETERERKIT